MVTDSNQSGPPLKDPKRKLSDEERRSIVLEVDDILGVSHENPEVYGIAKYAPSPLPTETDQAPPTPDH
jgi:hypothetical protein